MSPIPSQLQRYAAAVALVGLSTGVAEAFYRLTGSSRLSLVFLAGVLLSGVLLGSGPAYVAAVLAFIVYIYQVDPRFSFQFGSPEEFITLLVFLAVAMLTGSLTGRIRDQAERAQARARTTAVLFEASREFSASSDEAHIRRRLADHLAAAVKGEAFVHDASAAFSAPGEAKPGVEALAAAAALEAATTADPAEGWRLRPLRAGGETALGSAGWRAGGAQRSLAEDDALLEILADVGAAAIARARLAAAKADADTRARTEVLRNALLSSISHDLRTPLAAIMASATSLQAFGESFDAKTRGDLTATIQEEAERLNAFVGNLLNMTRLESGALDVQQVAFSVPEVVERIVTRRRGAPDRAVQLAFAGDLPEGLGDPVLFEQALGNVVENAMRYTPEARRVAVAAATEAGEIKVEVIDEGPGVPPEDLQRIFEKFFRSSATAQTPGTGLGLSIARGLLEGMGGSVAARNRDDGRSGLVVTMRLPAAA